MRYFEVDMSNHDHSDTYSMCIKATHFPTKREVKTFLRKDMENFGYTKIDRIVETTLEEARDSYYMENEKNFPVLGSSSKGL